MLGRLMYIIWQIFNYMKYRIDITPLPNCREISTMKVYESVMMPCREHPAMYGQNALLNNEFQGKTWRHVCYSLINIFIYVPLYHTN